MNEARRNGERLRASIAGSVLYGSTAGAAAFSVTALAVYIIASAVGAGVWFSVILGVAVGSLSFCALRLWLDESGFDSPNTKAYVIMAGTLSFIGITLAYITLNMYPFGDHTVLIIDMHHQYVAFYSLLRDKLLHGGSLLYSDSLGLGASFLPMWAYYLASPFSLLTLIFPREMITEALLLITVLKVTAAGVTFAIFVKEKFGRNDFSVVISGVAYSLMAFFVGHAWNLMWLDPIILLPLIVLGLERLLKDGRPGLYCITLAMALVCNYYIGYMICVFLVFYFLAYVISERNETQRPALSAKFWKIYRLLLVCTAVVCVAGVVAAIVLNKNILILAAVALMVIASSYFISLRFWRFCWASIVAGGMSAVVVLPTFLALMTTSGADDSFSRALASNFSFFELFPRTLFGVTPSMRGDNLPNVYCTVLALLLMVLYLTCGAIPLRKKLAWGGLVGVVAFSMSLNWLNFAWHGFHFPNDLPYRFSFLMSFAVLCCAVQMLDKLDQLRPGGVCISAVIIVALILIEQQFGSGDSDFVTIFVSMIAVIVYAVLIGLQSAGLMKKTMCYALLAVFVFSEAAANASVELVKLDANEYYTERASFVGDYEADSRTFELIDSYKNSPVEKMYREELLPRKTCNDPSLFGYDGLTVFASSNRRSVTTLMGKLGYAVNGVNSYLYKNYVPVTDSILGLKYVALGHVISGHQQLIEVGSAADSDGAETRYVYQNSTALNKAFVVSRSIINWDWEDSNPFIVQNDLVTCATGEDSVYDLILLEAGENSEYDNAAGYVNENSGTSLNEFNCSVSISGTYFTCSRVSEALTANFTATQKLSADGQTYAYVDCRASNSISVSAGSTNVSVSPTEPYIVDLGYLVSGTDVSVTVYTDMSCGGNIFLAQLNKEAFNAAIADMQQSMLQADVCKEGRISGTVTSPIDGMMFTSIPYDGGWTVRVDGEKVPTFALGSGLLCYAVPAGTHTVDMRFFPIGFVTGAVVTVLCITLFVLLACAKTRDWLRSGVPSALLADDGVDHQFENSPQPYYTVRDEYTGEAPGENVYPNEEKIDYIASDEGFEQVSMDELRYEPPVQNGGRSRYRGSVPDGFEEFFGDED